MTTLNCAAGCMPQLRQEAASQRRVPGSSAQPTAWGQHSMGEQQDTSNRSFRIVATTQKLVPSQQQSQWALRWAKHSRAAASAQPTPVPTAAVTASPTHQHRRLMPHLLRSPYDMDSREREEVPERERPWLLLLERARTAAALPLAAEPPLPLLSGAPAPWASCGPSRCWDSTDVADCVMAGRGCA